MFSRTLASITVLLGAGVGSLAAGGCAVGPNFHTPKANVPAVWSAAPAAPASQPETATEGIDLVHWWTAFNDPALVSLVERACESNLDLKQAEARVRQARAARGVAVAAFFPNISGVGSMLRNRSGSITPAGPVSKTTNLFQAGLDASWEIDVFGGVRRNVEAAQANIQAAVEDQRDTLVTLVAEVALNYIDLRGFQQQIVIAQENLKAQQRTADLTRKRFLGGLVGQLDVANADAQVATTAATIPVFRASAMQAIFTLGVLLGREPSALVTDLSATLNIPAGPPEVPLGLPSDLLRRRPDVRRAEAQAHSATALIGVATADLFPKFNLAASMGLNSNQLNTLTDNVSRIWALNPAFNWQLFDGGKTLSNIQVQNALAQQALLAYRKAVLTALQDVENALVGYAMEKDHRKALLDSVAANRRAEDLATRLYTQGQTDFLNVLDAQRSRYAAEDALVQSTRNISLDLVALYKALGGGWDEKFPIAPNRDWMFDQPQAPAVTARPASLDSPRPPAAPDTPKSD